MGYSSTLIVTHVPRWFLSRIAERLIAERAHPVEV